ncbi:MAG TPA: methyltransferase domain-containing protein [Anaerolineales bacterium]|nr:methyltransferase domain-containing protein [Anaerolineales bacterium]HRF49526.1 methyltransferase domain-containing protein [Anaerolineales bacterium]
MNDKRSLPPELYTEEYFLNACEGFTEFTESQGQRLSRRLNAAFAVAEIRPGMRVLDLGCGRGEIVRHCAELGAAAYGVDYSPVALDLARTMLAGEQALQAETGLARSDAKLMPFPDGAFDRVLIFDVVEHLFPWELDLCLRESRRVLKPGGMIVVHTAPNVWYDRYAYPLVRGVRVLMGQGAQYPRDPRLLNVAANADVHVNEQSQFSLAANLRRAGFRAVRAWLESPPQNRQESGLFRLARKVLFGLPPFRYFFEREVFAVGTKESGERGA